MDIRSNSQNSTSAMTSSQEISVTMFNTSWFDMFRSELGKRDVRGNPKNPFMITGNARSYLVLSMLSKPESHRGSRRASWVWTTGDSYFNRMFHFLPMRSFFMLRRTPNQNEFMIWTEVSYHLHPVSWSSLFHPRRRRWIQNLSNNRVDFYSSLMHGIHNAFVVRWVPACQEEDKQKGAGKGKVRGGGMTSASWPR